MGLATSFRKSQFCALDLLIDHHRLPSDAASARIVSEILRMLEPSIAHEKLDSIIHLALDITVISAARYCSKPRIEALKRLSIFYKADQPTNSEDCIPELIRLLRALRFMIDKYANIELFEPVHFDDNQSPVEIITYQIFSLLISHCDPEYTAKAGMFLLKSGWLRQNDPGGYDPAGCVAYDEMRRVLAPKTRCIFATKGKYWGAPKWQMNGTFEDNIFRIAMALDKFLKIGRKEGMDGFLLKAPAEFSATVNILARSTARILQGLSVIDPDEAGCLSRQIEAPEWKFRFVRESMFISTFGACYPEKHPRNTYSMDGTYFFFQPDYSLRMQPMLSERMEVETRLRILKAFEKSGGWYSNDNKCYEAARYVRPVAAEEPPVRWWDYLEL
ncbi:YqcI/YcgG family protein [Acidihalobacter prosperus]|uniref:YqcI/YcgG family protein n=1 Tax=Acidihalobacter prosperus TaxID=160660 RepID=UPI0011AB8E3E|nr:YqcI/YcgG family protein [Acidihalobacter prosperus]